jgi:hypothetical protein
VPRLGGSCAGGSSGLKFRVWDDVSALRVRARVLVFVLVTMTDADSQSDDDADPSTPKECNMMCLKAWQRCHDELEQSERKGWTRKK